jgi:aryl-alcohol dehydrogenase-like predicted oxidoreductase
MGIEIIIGTANLGNSYGIVNKSSEINRREFLSIVDYAIANNVKMIDTAISYGKAEIILGEINEKLKDFHILSKYYGVMNEKEDRLKPIDEVKKTINNLGINSLFCYFLHKAEDLYNVEIINQMIEIKNMGLATNIGVSVYSVDDAINALEMDFIDIIQVKYNVLDQELDNIGFFKEAINKKKKIYVRSVFLQGLLLQDTACLPNAFKRLTEHILLLDEIATEFRQSRLYILLFFIFMNESINGVIIGFDNHLHFKEIISTIRLLKPDKNLYKLLREKFCCLSLDELNPLKWGRNDV